jgi:outer membrane protein OmpA-like peptidoglycan-associated protein
MFFTACQKADSYGGCDIYFAKKTGNRWSEAINIGEPVNSRYWESQPSISSDGRTLYFVSNRPGGKGGMDIWKSYINDHGRFSKPENLGDSINTRGTESGPFIHPDNQTLYFASDAWLGMGGLDLYVSRKGVTNQWKRPDNLGYPINTHKDEEFLIVNAKGNLAYFSSNREGSRGKDIYNFELYDEAQPFQVTYVKGKVFDAVTNEKLKAKFELIDLETSKLVMEAFSHNKTGEFLVCLPVNKNYALNVSKTGYLFYSENFSLKNPENPSETFLMDIPLQPIREGAIVVLKNIFYETDKYDLKPESKAELSKLISFLNKNPKVNIEISGHTDNIGEDDYNIKLSRNRALSVYNYLTENEISNTRLSYEGYGENSPVASNETEKGRAQNRRTEFKIVK